MSEQPAPHYDEFSLFHENAGEVGIPLHAPPVVQRAFVEVAAGRKVSALVWGQSSPELVFLHGGGQNAHTWDTVALALDRPLLAIDLPGHGHSDWPEDSPWLNPGDMADDVAEIIGRRDVPRWRHGHRPGRTPPRSGAQAAPGGHHAGRQQ